MDASTPHAYDPLAYRGLTFHDAVSRFRDGSDSPRAYLERCIETIAAREPAVRALIAVNEDGARIAADASAARWKAGRPLSSIDGMPIAIKDLLETKDMPTQMGCDAYRGNFPKRDNAAVWALRQAGAVVLAKTVTAELGGAHPGPTRNPFDLSRSPGGSSSGSAAAVAARMVPAAIGTQVGGSIIRPAAFCGNVALKPSQGGINRGERMATSMSTHGVHAACIEDMWQVAIEIANRVGGDRGSPGLQGPVHPPTAVRPERLIVLEGEAWTRIDAASKAAFETLLDKLRAAGVAILRRGDDPAIEALENAVVNGSVICTGITGFENRWAQRNLVDEFPDRVSHRLKANLARAEAMTVGDYRARLLERETAQLIHRSIAGMGDAVISLACPGPAPEYTDDAPGTPLAVRPTGDASCNYPSSMLFAPAVSMPMLSVGGLPVGVQLMGQREEDAGITALARWIIGNVAPVAS